MWHHHNNRQAVNNSAAQLYTSILKKQLSTTAAISLTHRYISVCQGIPSSISSSSSSSSEPRDTFAWCRRLTWFVRQTARHALQSLLKVFFLLERQVTARPTNAALSNCTHHPSHTILTASHYSHQVNVVFTPCSKDTPLYFLAFITETLTHIWLENAHNTSERMPSPCVYK